MSSFRKPYTITRYAPGQYVDGDWQDGENTTLTVLASVQPLNMKEVDALPEGKRNSAAIKIYSDTELQPAEQATADREAVSADRISYLGSQWEITACTPHQAGVIPHYKSYAVKLTE